MKKEKIYIFIIGVLCFLIAASICVQYRSAHTYTTNGQAAVQSMTENKLRDKVLKEQENYNNLMSQLQNAQTELENLRKNSASSSDEAEQLEKQLSELNRVLGNTDVTGKGLIVTLKDADSTATSSNNSIVHDLDLVEVVNELFNAGAEAVSINGQRIVSTTAINCNGNVVKINNEKIAVPFVIKAIGSPDGLYGTMTRPLGYLELMENDSIKIKVEKKEGANDIVIPKYTGTYKYDYLQDAE